MITVTVKTLDSKNHVFQVSDEITVKDFKEEIVSKVSIPADEQRLIFRGRVLQNDKKLLEYNVANNTVHLVQRTTQSGPNSEANDNPPVSSNAGGRFGSEGGILFTAGTNPADAIIMGTIGIPSVQVGQNTVASAPTANRQNSAARRLQVGTEMLDRASTLLVRLEEDDAVAQARSNLETPENPSAPDSDENQSFDGGPMDIDSDDSASFGRVISQVANAASAAAVMASMRAMNESFGNAGGASNVPRSEGQAGEDNAAGNTDAPAQAANGAAANAGSPAVRPSAPRLRELAIALQDLAAFHNRLTPFLEFMQEALRTERNYSSESGELRSVQYTFDTLSAIMHCLGHSYHAYSDLICDFGTPAETRRLSAPATILVEQSTVVRATIPIAVPASFPTSGSPSFPNHSSASNADQPSPQGTNPQPNRSAQQQNNPLFGLENFLQGLNPNILGAGGMQGGVQGNDNGTGISINIQANGVPDFASLMGNAFGAGPGNQRGGPGNTPPAWLFGNMDGSNQNRPPQPASNQSQNASQTATANTTGAVPPQPASAGAGAFGGAQGPQINQQRIRNELMRPPFDILLHCHSHHHSRNRNTGRPSNFREHVRIGEVPTNRFDISSPEFFESLVDILRFSSWLDILHPYIKDFVQNYLMRGRDVKNSLHIKTCARALAKKYLVIFTSLLDSVRAKDEGICYEKTFTELLTKFFSQLINLALNADPDKQFRRSVLHLWDQFMSQLFSVLRFCFPDNNHVPAIFASIVSDSTLPGMPVVFRRHVTERLQAYFIDLANNAAARTETADNVGVVFNEKEKEIPSTALPSTCTASAQQVAPNSSKVEIATTKPENQVSGATALPLDTEELGKDTNTFHDAMDTYIDDLVDQIPMRPQESNNPRSEGPMQNIPEEWRNVVQRDVMRQFGMPRQPPPSSGFEALFPRKH